MKIMNKFQKKLANRKKDNKGFSLVELIIVIAIMAILVGIVGTQVIPYISKSKVAKDQQVLNSISTAAVTAYSENAEKITDSTEITIDNVFDTQTDELKKSLVASIQEASGFKSSGSGASAVSALNSFKNALAADGKDDIIAVKVTYDQANHKVTTEVVYGKDKDGKAKDPKYPIQKVEATL